MRKYTPLIIAIIAFSFASYDAGAQSFLDKLSKKLDKAMDAVDKLVSDPNDPAAPAQSGDQGQSQGQSQTPETETASRVTPKEPLFMGFNGDINSIEINKGNSHISVYTFDTAGNLIERKGYYDTAKKTLTEKDTYKRGSDGRPTEEYKGFNLNDNHYIGESLWRVIEKNGNKERWQKIDNDWWGTSYREVEYLDDSKKIYDYVIQKKNGVTSNESRTVETFNERGQMISRKTTTTASAPVNTTTWTYSEDGHLLKEELKQVHSDGTTNNVVNASFTIDKTDNHNNPLQVTDADGTKITYTYSYR